VKTVTEENGSIMKDNFRYYSRIARGYGVIAV
jgi:hypothetical protein